ncbi:hypothetical protein N0V90_005500 [Kalmusia sp. IMI 367209]|nr:hypothetical protein N0V90_005500 [Kalmusia sp. IMI 367209]
MSHLHNKTKATTYYPNIPSSPAFQTESEPTMSSNNNNTATTTTTSDNNRSPTYKERLAQQEHKRSQMNLRTPSQGSRNPNRDYPSWLKPKKRPVLHSQGFSTEQQGREQQQQQQQRQAQQCSATESEAAHRIRYTYPDDPNEDPDTTARRESNRAQWERLGYFF